MQFIRNAFLYSYLFLLSSSIATLLGFAGMTSFWLFNAGTLLSFYLLDRLFSISNFFSAMTLIKWPLYGLGMVIISDLAFALGFSVVLTNLLVLATPLMFELTSQALTLTFLGIHYLRHGAAPQPAQDPLNPVFHNPINPEPVFQLAQNHDVPANEDDDDQHHDLRQMAQRGVYGIVGYNRRQRAALDDMRVRYRDEFVRKGRPAIFEEIRQHFIREYNNNPARNLGIPLPMAYRGHWFTNNAPYYQHTTHTAYRYLFLRPNPWLSPFAGFTTPVGNGRAANTSDEDLTKIAYMWLAATDNNRRLPEGQTRESLLNEFTIAIAELGRAYNHPNQVDDLEGDKPTCPAGANQRINQFYMVFLNDRPETRPLTTEILSQKFQQEMINESPVAATLFNKMRAMNPATLDHLESALNKGIMLDDDLTAQETAALNLVTFSAMEVDAYINTCKTYFGANRISNRRPDQNRIAFMDQRFHSYEEMIRYLAQNSVKLYCQHLLRNIEQLRNAQNQAPRPQGHRRAQAV